MRAEKEGSPAKKSTRDVHVAEELAEELVVHTKSAATFSD